MSGLKQTVLKIVNTFLSALPGDLDLWPCGSKSQRKLLLFKTILHKKFVSSAMNSKRAMAREPILTNVSFVTLTFNLISLKINMELALLKKTQHLKFNVSNANQFWVETNFTYVTLLNLAIYLVIQKALDINYIYVTGNVCIQGV